MPEPITAGALGMNVLRIEVHHPMFEVAGVELLPGGVLGASKASGEVSKVCRSLSDVDTKFFPSLIS